MAKRIDNTDLYEPGCIYELQVCVDGNWYPFYVGETTNAERRLAEHQWAAKNATESSTLVYRTIRYQFEPAGCEWRMMKVHDYGNEGPEAAEDEHIMMLLRQNQVLTNEKKGNVNWMAERQAQAADMRARGITSYAKYKQTITQEQMNERHQEWLAEDATYQRQALPDSFYREVEARAEKLALAEHTKKQRAERRAAAVAAHRALQIAEWEEQND